MGKKKIKQNYEKYKITKREKRKGKEEVKAIKK